MKRKTSREIYQHLADIRNNLNTHITKASAACSDQTMIDALLEDLGQLETCMIDVQRNAEAEELDYA